MLFRKNLSNAISRSGTESQGRAFVIGVEFVIDPRGKNVSMNGITVVSKPQKQGVIGIDLGLILNEYSGRWVMYDWFCSERSLKVAVVSSS